MITDEETAKRWLYDRFGAAILGRLAKLAELVLDESQRQNLISRGSIDVMWVRHIADSAQLVTLGADCSGRWLDVGTGGGFPGLVVAICRNEPIVLVEPRRRRANFLRRCADELRLPLVEVEHSDVEKVVTEASVISARAVAGLGQLIEMTMHCAGRGTCWLLPRGSYAQDEAIAVADTFGLMFHVKQSITHPGSVVLVGRKRQ